MEGRKSDDDDDGDDDDDIEWAAVVGPKWFHDWKLEHGDMFRTRFLWYQRGPASPLVILQR
jgi:hypothetical protein